MYSNLIFQFCIQIMYPTYVLDLCMRIQFSNYALKQLCSESILSIAMPVVYWIEFELCIQIIYLNCVAKVCVQFLYSNYVLKFCIQIRYSTSA